ncbi:MAG: VWA domain-containing protein [Deltaproteobacteria bacterium]|nr:VWA domain-containing protein [Deltaproteobacteria bacterium]
MRNAIVVALSCSLWSTPACTDESSASPPGELVGLDAAAALDAESTANDVAFDVAEAAAAVECRVALRDGSACACTEIGQRPPTLYLLLDRSGSMGDKPAGSSRSKWSLVRSALLAADTGVLRRLGTRVSIAMGWFPSPASEDACNPGRHVLGPTWGGPSAYDALDAKLAAASPRGSTPTAASLRALLDRIPSLPPPVHVVLATDGAPTCGSGPCGADACTYNLEGDQLTFGGSCNDSFNCCDPANTTRGLGWKACVDLESTRAAAAALAAAGAKVFVLGVPGAVSQYGAVLDEIAIAGGAPREGEPKYYAAAEPTQEALAATLSSIAAKVIDTCDVRLDAPVEEPGITNVLLDGEAIPEDDGDGWRWTSPSTIALVGSACARIHAGTVTRIQVAVGCKTVTR